MAYTLEMSSGCYFKVCESDGRPITELWYAACCPDSHMFVFWIVPLPKPRTTYLCAPEPPKRTKSAPAKGGVEATDFSISRDYKNDLSGHGHMMVPKRKSYEKARVFEYTVVQGFDSPSPQERCLSSEKNPWGPNSYT